jgi:hypothetical protein
MVGMIRIQGRRLRAAAHESLLAVLWIAVHNSPSRVSNVQLE